MFAIVYLCVFASGTFLYALLLATWRGIDCAALHTVQCCKCVMYVAVQFCVYYLRARRILRHCCWPCRTFCATVNCWSCVLYAPAMPVFAGPENPYALSIHWLCRWVCFSQKLRPLCWHSDTNTSAAKYITSQNESCSSKCLVGTVVYSLFFVLFFVQTQMEIDTVLSWSTECVSHNCCYCGYFVSLPQLEVALTYMNIDYKKKLIIDNALSSWTLKLIWNLVTIVVIILQHNPTIWVYLSWRSRNASMQHFSTVLFWTMILPEELLLATTAARGDCEDAASKYTELQARWWSSPP